jgi:hypothetical protein
MNAINHFRRDESDRLPSSANDCDLSVAATLRLVHFSRSNKSSFLLLLLDGFTSVKRW